MTRNFKRAACLAALSLSASAQTYEIVSRNTGKVLDVQGVSTANGALVQQWDWLAGHNQQWQLIPIDSTYYKIVSQNNGKVLDVQNASTANGALTQQWDYQGSTSQQWQLVSLDGTFYRIVNKNSGKVLDVQGGSASNGALIQQYDYLGGANQQWQLIPYAQYPPTDVSVSPSSGAGNSQSFQFTASSPNGFTDIGTFQVIFNSSLTAVGGCYLYYTPSANLIAIANDQNTAWLAGANLGSGGTIGNSQCQLNVGASWYSGSGNTGTLMLTLNFQSSFAGAKNIYLATGEGRTGMSTGWLQMGTWNTTAPSYQGWLDVASCSSIAGWAENASQTNSAVTVNFYLDGAGTPSFSATANQFRQDLLNAGIGTGYYGFSLAAPAALMDGYTHSISARYGTSGIQLLGSPKSVQCGTPPPGPTTVTSVPAGLVVIVDGSVPYTTPFSLAGNHTVAVASPQTRSMDGAGVEYQFSNWSDGGANGHTISAGATVTVNFTTWYQLSVVASPSARHHSGWAAEFTGTGWTALYIACLVYIDQRSLPFRLVPGGRIVLGDRPSQPGLWIHKIRQRLQAAGHCDEHPCDGDTQLLQQRCYSHNFLEPKAGAGQQPKGAV